MKRFDYSIIAQQIRTLRKEHGMSQQNLADELGKSLRTVQKYEKAEIEVSIATINDLAKIFNVSSTVILGYQVDANPIQSLSDVFSFLFKLDEVNELGFTIDVKRPPNYDEVKCSITFDGKDFSRDYNSAMCRFLESWQFERERFNELQGEKDAYDEWKDQKLAYYSSADFTQKEYVELSPTEKLQKRIDYLNSLLEEQKKAENKDEG